MQYAPPVALATVAIDGGHAHARSPPHVALAQSTPILHRFPIVHRGQTVPPQSVSVSLPSVTPFLQFAVEQTLPVHEPPAQSVAATHAFPSTHGAHSAPPQSTSVSWPSLIVLLHVFGIPASPPSAPGPPPSPP